MSPHPIVFTMSPNRQYCGISSPTMPHRDLRARERQEVDVKNHTGALWEISSSLSDHPVCVFALFLSCVHIMLFTWMVNKHSHYQIYWFVCVRGQVH